MCYHESNTGSIPRGSHTIKSPNILVLVDHLSLSPCKVNKWVPGNMRANNRSLTRGLLPSTTTDGMTDGQAPTTILGRWPELMEPWFRRAYLDTCCKLWTHLAHYSCVVVCSYGHVIAWQVLSYTFQVFFWWSSNFSLSVFCSYFKEGMIQKKLKRTEFMLLIQWKNLFGFRNVR